MQIHTINEQLYVEIYTIGYEPMGEGIVIKIKDEENTFFCGVIDCFEIEKLNKTLEIVKNEKIDLICLTHPDEDHCKGLEKVLKLADSNTKILYPDSMLYYDYKSKESAYKVITEISKFLIKYRNNNNKPKMISCVGTQKIINDINFFDARRGGIYNLEINTFTPITSIIDRKIANTILDNVILGDIDNNKLSIMMSITIGRLKLLFCGDVEDDTIIELNKYIGKEENDFFYDIIDYIKIPHHGSDNSVEMFRLLSNVNKVSNSISTVYRSSRLPNREILERYKRKKGKIYCTGNIEKNDDLNNYGIVKHSFDIINNTVKTELFKNAQEVS